MQCTKGTRRFKNWPRATSPISREASKHRKSKRYRNAIWLLPGDSTGTGSICHHIIGTILRNGYGGHSRRAHQCPLHNDNCAISFEPRSEFWNSSLGLSPPCQAVGEPVCRICNAVIFYLGPDSCTAVPSSAMQKSRQDPTEPSIATSSVFSAHDHQKSRKHKGEYA